MQTITIKQKPKKQKRKRKRLKCYQCIHSSTYDSNFDNQVIDGRVYCRRWQSVVQIGCARSCRFFEADKPVKVGKNKKNRRRW